MSRSKRSREQLLPGLLPFMAVLLCTMGALVLILILMVSNSQASAKKKIDEHEVEIDLVTGEFSMIAKNIELRRKEQQADIDLQRQHLSNYEDHIARLEKELADLQAMIEKISHPIDPKESKIQFARRAEELKTAILEAEKKIQETKKKASEQKPAFAILPYKGPNGTNRRPIYIECVADCVIIQPEGVELPVSLLRPPFGPGNPLDAALRLIRTEHQRESNSTSTLSSPYPLLLVRPEGIKSYSLARAALGGWDDQFGYELVDGSMKLAFPPKTPGLSDALQRTIAAASQRHSELIAAMPSRYEASSWDDFQPESNAEDSKRDTAEVTIRKIPEGAKWELLQEISPSTPIRNSANPNDDRTSMAIGNSASPSSKGTSPFQGQGTNKLASPYMTEGSLGSGLTMGGGGNPLALESPSLAYRGGGGQAGGIGAGDQASESNGSSFQGESAASPGGNSSDGGVARSGASPQGGSSQQGSNMQPIFLSSETENMFGNNPSQEGNPPSQVSVSNQSQASSSKGATNGKPGPTNSSGRDSNDKTAAAQNRGWAQNRSIGKATPIVRDIRVAIMTDRWLVLTDSVPNQVESAILLEQGPSAASSQLSKVVRDRVATWGVAVSGGYWKPRIVAETYPGSETSYSRLEKLLEGSGVEIAVQPAGATPRR